eukprot:m.344854 g.344854  ORF g.344854 m.344854 type:complete len:122 (+) comp55802_c1_seq3:2-367(+)
MSYTLMKQYGTSAHEAPLDPNVRLLYQWSSYPISIYLLMSLSISLSITSSHDFGSHARHCFRFHSLLISSGGLVGFLGALFVSNLFGVDSLKETGPLCVCLSHFGCCSVSVCAGHSSLWTW